MNLHTWLRIWQLLAQFFFICGLTEPIHLSPTVVYQNHFLWVKHSLKICNL